MRVAISALAILLIIEWAIVYFGYHGSGFFHLVLIFAVTTLIVQWLPDR